jgi:hypothetical protein
MLTALSLFQPKLIIQKVKMNHVTSCNDCVLGVDTVITTELEKLVCGSNLSS